MLPVKSGQLNSVTDYTSSKFVLEPHTDHTPEVTHSGGWGTKDWSKGAGLEASSGGAVCFPESRGIAGSS